MILPGSTFLLYTNGTALDVDELGLLPPPAPLAIGVLVVGQSLELNRFDAFEALEMWRQGLESI
jgi:hypothetical protein